MSLSLLRGGICAMNRLLESSLYQLTTARFRLFLREPEAIFWIFIFPILLAVGLGIAFRNRPADVLPVAGFRLFLGDRGAFFWFLISPILLAVVLGIAFRNRPADVLPVAATTTQ